MYQCVFYRISFSQRVLFQRFHIIIYSLAMYNKDKHVVFGCAFYCIGFEYLYLLGKVGLNLLHCCLYIWA